MAHYLAVVNKEYESKNKINGKREIEEEVERKGRKKGGEQGEMVAQSLSKD